MTLTARQQKALAAAPASARAAMKAAFAKQPAKKSIDTSAARPKRRVTELAKARSAGSAAQKPSTRKLANVTHPGRDPFDPTNVIIPPSLMHVSGVFPLQGHAREELVQIAGRRYILAVTAIPGSPTIGMLLRVELGGANTASLQTTYNVPTMNALPDAGGPTSLRWTKIGASFENATPRMYQGGRVYFTHVTQRFNFPAAPSVMTADQWAAVTSTLRSMPETNTQGFGWDAFGSGGPMHRRCRHVKVVDEPKYQEFQANLGALATIDSFFNNIALWTGSVEDPHPMSILLISWDTPAVVSTTHVLQDLTLHLHAQALTRWPVSTVPGQNQLDIPAASQAAVDKSRRR